MLKRTVLTVLALGLTVSAVAQTQLPTKQVLTLDAAKIIAAAAEAEATRNGWAVSIAIVGDSGQLRLFRRMDDAKLAATDIAIRKARTSAYFEQPTVELEEEVDGGRNALLSIDGFMPLQGGIPIVVAGMQIGGIGVSGVSGEQDEQCAVAGAAALAAR
jgi:glc operon protein GlcG